MLQNILNKLDKLAAKTGLLSGFELGARDSYSNEFANESMGYARSVAELLPYRTFDRAKNLFINDECVVGFILELIPTVGIDSSLEKNLKHFLNDDIPQDSYLQFMLLASPRIGGILSKWSAARTNPHPMIQKITEARKEFLGDLALSKDIRGTLVSRDFKLYLSFSQKLKKVDENQLEKIRKIQSQILNKLKPLQLFPRICDATDLINLLDEIINVKSTIELSDRKYNNYLPLCDQIPQPGYKFRVKPEHIEHENQGFITKCYNIQEKPLEFSLAQMIHLLGDGARTSLAIPARFIISYTIAANIAPSQQEALVTKGRNVVASAEQWYARHDSKLKEEASEWLEVIDYIKGGGKFLSDCFQVILTADSNIIEEVESRLLSLYKFNDWKLVSVNDRHLPALQFALPLCAAHLWSDINAFKFTGICPSNEPLAKLPIHGEFKGVPMSGVLLQAVRGQLFNFNNFYKIADGNFNISLFGPSGVGKSVLLQEYVVSQLALGNQVFVLDIGKSFKNICKLFDGEFISFTKDSKISLNPFSSIKLDENIMKKTSSLEEDNISQDDSIGYAKNILGSMCGATNDKLKEAIVEWAINEGMEKYGHELNIDRIAAILLNEGSLEAINLGKSLYPYTSKGIYGKYFNKETNISFKKQLVVIELEEIRNDKSFLSVLCQIINLQIILEKATGDRTTQFSIILDEGWELLNSGAGPMFEAVFRTIRKLRGAAIICVQNFNDLNSDDTRKSIFNNSTWKLILKQSADGLEAFRSVKAFERILPLIESITVDPGKFAELLIYSTAVQVKARLILDPYSKNLYSTDADDFVYINKLINSGLSMDQAINSLVVRKKDHVRA
ncbi:MAG: hypothetical protein K0R02_704 [Rickettsiaceae bacterium]|jgi:type-IV secretion system protein TraC|nr:hypothetical protein [Rickettsiaceae bacterium]